MTGPDHYRAAERILAGLSEVSAESANAHAGLTVAIIARAQVHAMLAMAAATALAADPTAEGLELWDPMLMDDDT